MVIACLLCEEMGRVLLPVPYISTVVLGGSVLRVNRGEVLHDEILKAIGNGECIISSALMEGERFENIESPQCKASKKGGTYLLTGSKKYVENAHASDYLLLTARARDGLTLFLVDPRSEGIALTEQRAMGGEKLFTVSLTGVKVDPIGIVGEAGKAWPSLENALARSKTALAARMIGSAAAVIDRSVQYAKERIQFDKPIGSFQAIAFRLADMATGLLGARLLMYKAAWMIDREKPAAVREAAMAKAFVAELHRLITDVGVHTYGGYGFMLEHDMQLFYRRAKAEEMAYGDARYNRSLICPYP
jgi:alkylation response protein AidB-like acyl-CoA dehydrogenase